MKEKNKEENKMNKKIEWDDLSTGLKWAIVGGYITVISLVISLIGGFMGAL